MAKLWEIISDTPRWSEASGLPKYQVSEQLQADGRVKVLGKLEIIGITFTWEELPVNWVAERWFEQRRIFQGGPLSSMTTVATLEDLGDTSRVDLELRLETRNLLGTFLAKRMAATFEDKIRILLTSADQLIKAEKPGLFISTYEPAESSLKRAAKLRGEIDATPYGHGLTGRLVDHINASQEVDLWTMRPIALARRWGASTRNTIELFLQSVRSGLLESRWEVLCPRCRVSKSASSNIGELPQGVHCESCNIDFQSDFSSNVELTFRPSSSIRLVEDGHFCRSGPGVTPHVKCQCSLEPGEIRTLPLTLRHGDYRLRTLEAGAELKINWHTDCFPEIHIDERSVNISAESPPGEIRMLNKGAVHRSVIIEEQTWLRDVLTAERVTTLQAFRDLFSEQVLRPGDEVSIRNISFMFTDLVGSSRLFSQMGDAQAYHLVREHFAEMIQIVRRHQGNIVKTSGDGVHAAFPTPEDAIRAAIDIQQAMTSFNQRLAPEAISVRIGLHCGSSIAVTLNDRLDYYGRSVNLAARLESLGSEGEIVMSGTFASDPTVNEIIADYDKREDAILIKGFADAVEIVKIKP